MTKPQLYSLFGTHQAYPSAVFGVPDMRSMQGLYAFGDAIAPSTVVSSIGVLTISDRVVNTIAVRVVRQ